MNKKKLLFDISLIAVLLIAASSAILIMGTLSKSGAAVRVSVNGAAVAEYPLSQSGEYSLADGGNILVIKDGEAYISSADCPDRLCVSMGRISRTGERITCLPNRVIVEIVGESDGIFGQ